MMLTLSQSPTDPDFVQDPYAFYETARARAGQFFHWQDYGLACALGHGAVAAVLRDRRLGREPPSGLGPDKPAHQAGFWAIEDHSMLELEPPRHTRLRGLVLRAFTSRRIAAMQPQIAALSHALIDRIEGDSFDLLPVFANALPVIVIARLLGVPESRSQDLLHWSHAMVGMYMAGRTEADERAAAAAASDFADFIRDHVNFRRDRPEDDLITHLIAAEEDGERLSTAELIATCVLLLNAGHEATVHTIGNGVRALIAHGHGAWALTPDAIDATIEEILRFDPPLHMFQRWVYEDLEFSGHEFAAGDRIGCLLAAANRDPGRWDEAHRFIPDRAVQTNSSFGAGTHFCLGAPLARLELKVALPILFDRLPGLALDPDRPPRYARSYHFHGLEALWLRR